MSSKGDFVSKNRLFISIYFVVLDLMKFCKISCIILENTIPSHYLYRMITTSRTYLWTFKNG